MINEDRKKLYDALSSEYDLGTYEEFERNIGDSVKRRKLYDAASADYDLGDFESYSQRIGPTHKESLDAFTAEHGSWLNDFEARDSAETNMSKAGMSSGIYVPAEGSITGEERKRYRELHKQEEALKKAWFTSDEYLAQKDADALFLSNVQKDLSRQRVEYAQANPPIKQEGLFQTNPYAVRGVEADTELERFATASRLMDDAIKMHNAPSRYDDKNVFLKFGKGAGDVLSDADFWTAGLTEIADNLGVRDVLSTVQEKLGNLNDLSEEAIENILSPAEKAVLQAWAINTQEQLKRKDDLSRAYQAGQGATESLAFMAEFALTGGIGKAATEGVEQMVKWLGKKALTKVGGMTDDVAAKVLKETGEKIAQSTVGKYGVGLAESLAEAAGRTGVMPSTFRNISEKATEIETDENGNNYLVKMNDAFAKGYVDSFIENLSEGGRVNALGTLFGDVAGKIPAYKKMVDKFSHTKASELWDAFNSSGVMNTLRAGGWHGLGEEYLEEWYGNALRTLTGVDKEALKDFATVDNQIVTLTSFLPMTIFGGTVSTAQVLSANKELEKKAAALKSALMERGYDEAQANNMIDMMRGAAPAEVSETLTPIVNSVANRNTNEAAALMKPVGEFAAAVQRWQSFNTKYNYQEQEQRDGLRAQMEENLGQFWQQDENGRQTVQRGVNDKGEVVYMLGKPSVEDVEAGVTSEVAAVTSDGRKVFVNPSEYQLEDELEMNTFLGNEIMAEKGNQEQARMIEEKEAKIAAIREAAVPGTAVNIGTAEAPMQAIVLQRNPDGVIVNTPDGQTRQMTYEEFGNYVGVNAVPMTDAQIDEHEADVLTADRAQREAALDQEYENEDAALDELAEAEDEIEQAVDSNIPLPMKADGSVDQTALWNNDPERWAQWNDEQRQDGGANSLAYINSAVAREQTKLAEIVGAYEAEPDFDARSAMESEIAVVQDRLNRLAVLQQNYAPLITQQNKPDASTEKMSDVQKGQRPRERSVESEVARLYELGLSDEEVLANLDAKVTKVQKALDAQSKKAPKMGADENAYITKKREHQQKMQELQQELDFASAARQAVSDILAQQTQMPDYSGVIAIEKDAEPQNAVEFAARELGLKDGGIKLQRQSFAEHTGYGPSEMKKFFGLFKSKQDGGLTIEQAGERLMELDRENNTGFFNQNDPNAGMNAILDALGAVNTIGELRSYVARQRQAEAQREADAAYSAMMAEYEATYGETMEERAHYDEVMRSEILINGLSENEQRELNNIIFAEEILQNGTEGYQTEASGVYESETGSNATDVEPGTEGVYTGSNGILQETQSDNSGRDAESQENQRRSEGEGGEQDALPSVPTGESTTAVESSLDEDMPDFTSSASSYFPSDEMKRKFSTMRARINDWAQKLGVQVRIMETLDDVVNQSARQQILAGRKVYGYFDPATGEVAFYLPDFLSLDGHELTEEEFVSEIDKTYIHEVVSHRGLRGLLGEEKYGELCDMVWDAMTEQQKANFLSYPGVNGNTRTAADEFIAHFAENVDYNDNRTLWDKIVDFIKDFFNSVELPAGISNESLAELLRHSYRNLAKSAAPIDTNANQQAEGNSVLRAANGSLVGLHNISEDKLRKVLKQGGLANPSTAVVNISEYLLDEYGEISLIMPSSLVDASTGDNIGTYTGDAWTPTYPPISRKVDDRGWKIIKDRIRAAIGEESELYSDIVHGVDNYLDDNRSSKMEFVFLKEKGIEPEIAYKGADGFVGMRNLEAILGVQGLRDGLESYERYKNASPMAKRSFNMWLDAAGNKQSHRELKEQLKKEPKLADVLKLNEDVSFADFDSFTYNIFRKEQDAGKIDTYDTMGAAARYVDANNLRGEFEAWLELLMEQAGAKEVFFAGYTRSGERIYKDNTLENVSRHMRLQGRTNAYDDHGLSATKSALLQRMTSLSQIRKNKARLQNESAYNKEYDALKDRLFNIISQLADMQEISSNRFMNIDYAESRLQDAISKKNPVAYLNKEYGYEIDPAGEYAEELKSFIKDVQQMPAKYFETKFERPVYLNEFAAAVMPTTTSEDVKQAVSEAGLPIFEYDSEVEGLRKEATLKATEGEGIRFRTLGEKGAANLDKAEEATIRLDNLAVARQMEKSGKDAKAIKLATGWERGVDKLWRYEVPDDFDLAELENRLQENLNDGLSKTWGVLYPSDLGELTKAYPDFNVDIMVWVGEEFENTGVYSPATEGDETTFGRSASIEVKAKTVADIKDVLVHEIQHAIQEMEGFAEGGQARGLNDKLSAELDKRVATIKQLREEGRNEEADEFMQMSKGLAEAVINNDDDAYGNYKKLAGEVEARNAATRIGKSLQERRESLLSETEDVAREDQIILMENLGVNHMADGNGGVRLTSSNASIARFDKVNGTDVRGFIDFLKNDKEFVAGKPTVFHIANAGDLLGLFGIKGKFMVGQFTFSRTHTVNADHELGVKEWIDVINNLNNPIAITSYKGQPNQFRIYTYATINGRNICVGVNVSTKDGSIELANIISAYGRDIQNLLGNESVFLLYPSTIQELKQKISQVSTAHNSLLNATSSALSADKGSNNLEKNNIRFRMRTEEEDAMEFQESVLEEFKQEYRLPAPTTVVDVYDRDAVANALGYAPEKFTDAQYDFIMKGYQAGGVSIFDPETKRIAIFAKETLNESWKMYDCIFHENTHFLVAEHPDLLELGEWLWQNSEPLMRKIIKEHILANDTYKGYETDEMLSGYTGVIMATGKADVAYAKTPEELRKHWDLIFNAFGYGRKTEDNPRRRGTGNNAGRVESSGNRADASAEQKHNDAAKQELTAEERRVIGEYFPEFNKSEDVRYRISDVNTNPTEAQKKAGNYKKGHIRLDSYNITIENPKGSVRRGTDSKGNAWENTLNNDYGYIRGTEGVDGDHIDVYLSDNPTEGNVFVIDQVNPETREFDEHKVMYGFNSAEEAREAYLANFSEGWNGLGTITEVSKDEFKKWIESSHRKTKPFSEYKSVRANEMQATDESELRYRVVSDQETLDRLNSEPTIKVYRAMQLIDGKLYPPMSAKVDGELRQPIELGQWEEAEERPDLVDEKGRFKLDKGNKSSLKARYNPYFHTSPTPLNDQFSSAQTRPELVTVEVEVPESELTSGYKAEKAKDSVGKMEWKAGVVQSKLSGTRTVILSRWDKPVRIVPDSEVADVIVDMFEGKDITMPSNVVTPSLRAELEKRGVPFVETDNQGNPVEEVSFRVTGTPTDEVVANGLQLTPAQTAEVAANIFAALPEESRKKITEGLNGNILGLKDAILQIPTSLATKENWNDEDRAMADVVAEEMTKMAGEMTRPFSAEEGLWLLYNNLNKGTDLISQASRALVQRNLGFDAETLAKQEQAKEDVRFRTVGDANSNAKASLYNRGAVNVWTRLKESFVDMQASVEELVKAIEKRTGKVAQGFENILLALNQQSSKGLAAMESYTQKFLNPMFDEIRRIMDETKMKYEDIVRYVILKHGLERNKKLAQRDARAHYQEIYDDIISKITGMTAAQKRTYLTNAQLKEGDAKAELATLQAVDMSAMTDDEKREHKRKLAAARKAVEEAEEHLKRAQKIASMSEQDAQDELDKIFEKIENGTDSVYKEMRENDYSGISSMFYDQLGVDRKNFSTEEQYQAALMDAKKDRYSSLKDVEAAAEAEVKSFEGKTDTKELWKRINAATKETLRQQYEANMISKDQYLNLRDMFEYYVPLRGFKENTAEDMYTYYRKPNSTGYTKPILGAEGRKTEAESPFGWIAAMAGSAIASNVKNEAKLALYYFVSNRPENGIATISKTWFVDSGEVDERGKKIFKPAYPPFSEDLSSAEGKAQYEIWQANMKELQKKGQAYEAGQRLNLGNAVVNISDANKPEHIVNIKVGGKDYTIVINGNPRAAQAINGDLNIEGTAQDYSALFGPVLRWMSSVNTSYNPEFWITNMMRDMAFTWMAVNIKEDPAYRRKFSKNYRKAFKVISLVAKNEKGTIGDSYLEQQYKDFVKYGGVTGYTQIKDSETWEKEIDNYLSSNDPKSVKNGKVMRGMKSAFHVAHRFGESLEQVSRFAAFLTARETGKSINEAINDAKEITVNFNRKGSGKMITLEEAKYLTGKNGQPLTKPQQWMVVGLSSIAPLGRRFIMFFNAAIQGLNATYKLMKKNPKRFTGWALGYAAVGMMNAVLHAMLDDDDDYLDIPQYERRNSLMIGGNGAYFKWALPQEARAFYALGDLAVETVMGRNPHQNFLGEALKIGTEILPVNPSEGWKAFMPSIAIPFIELALNEDYKGAPIYNEQKWLSEEEKKRTAKWSSAYQGTGWMYVKIAQGLNYITDGPDYDKTGLINLQPEKLEHLVQSAFGGTIRTADKFISTILAAIDPEEPMTIRQAPFLNRFLTINDERFKNVHVNDVFDYYKADAEHALTLEKQYIKDRDMDALTKLRSSDEYQWAKIYRKYKKPLKAIQDKIKVADGTAEKKELMKQQDELKKRMIKEISKL